MTRLRRQGADMILSALVVRHAITEAVGGSLVVEEALEGVSAGRLIPLADSEAMISSDGGYDCDDIMNQT